MFKGHTANGYQPVPSYPTDEQFNLTAVAHNAGNTIKQAGNYAVKNAPRYDINEIRNELEGPKPLRATAGLCGAALTGASLIGMLNLPSFFVHPFIYLVQIYTSLFGLVIVLIELKSVGKSGTNLKEWVYRWFPFVSMLGGKGLTYMFFGTLGLSIGLNYHSLLFIPSVAVIAIGGIYCCFHLGKCNSLEDKYEVSHYYSTYMRNP